MGFDRMMPALYRAAVEGKHEDYYEALRHMAMTVADNQVTPSGNTVLHVAALHGQKQFVENILETEEDRVASSMLFSRNNKDETVLQCAAEKGYADIVSLIITATKKYKDVELGVGVREMIGMRDKVKDTALHKAVRMGHREVVRLLVNEDPEFEYPANDDGETPIYIAAELQFDECLVEMLNTCKKPTYDGPLGRNALHAAILSGFEETSSWFKIWNHSTTYRFPFRGIRKVYNSKCTKRLLETEISLCEKNDDFGWTPLHYAIKVYNAEAAGMILERKTSAAYIHAGNDKEWTTVFHIAARAGNVEMMKEISNKCPDCWETMNSKGQNVLHEAVVSNRVNVIQHIESSNQFDHLVHQKDMDGNTPLHLLNIFNSRTVQRILRKHAMQNYLFFNKNHQTLFDRMDLELKRPRLHSEFHKMARFWSGRKIVRRVGLTENLNPKQKNSDEEEEKIKTLIETSKTRIVVATLILTITFAAGFTVPGGYDTNPGKTQGTPILLRNKAFLAFIIADVYAFMCSICCIIIYNAMVGEASSASRRYKSILSLYMFQKGMLFHASLGVVIAFLCGMYATLAPLRALAVAVLLFGFGISLHTYNIWYNAMT